MEHKDLIQKISELSCKEIFSSILSKQIYGLMFHDQMASYFDFLCLNGFNRLHEYQYLDESVNYRKTQRYFINCYNEIVQSNDVKDPEAIPSEWLRHTRHEVTPAVKQRAVKEGFEEYRDWEKHVEECYSAYAKVLYERGMLNDYSFVLGLICDVSKELKKLDRLILKMSSTDYDMTYVEEMQDELHEKYKKKTHEVTEEL